LTVFNRGSAEKAKKGKMYMSLMPMLAEGMTGNIHVGLAALGAAIGVASSV